jgi:hypothetical protein
MLTDHAAATSRFTETVVKTGITAVLGNDDRIRTGETWRQAVLDGFIQFMRDYSQM